MATQPIVNYAINGTFPVTVGGTGTAAKYFGAPSGNFTAGASVTPSATSAVGQLPVPGRNILNGQQFEIIAAGNYEVGSGGACPNVLIEVVANTGTVTSPTYTVIMTSGQVTAQNLTGTFYDWFFDANVIGTTASGTLTGVYTAIVDGTVVRNNVALTNTISGLAFGPTASQAQAANISTTDPVFGLVVRVTFSVSEPGNAANLYEFAIY